MPAVKFFRQEWNRLLGEGRPKGVATDGMHTLFRLQHQAYDHVLREREQKRDDDSFANVANYILENPVRANLVSRYDEWPYLGALVPTFPRMDSRQPDFWDAYWKMHFDLLESPCE